MDRPLLAMRAGVKGLLAILGALVGLFVLVVSGLTPVSEVLALLLIVLIPTAALAEQAWLDLGELRSGD